MGGQKCIYSEYLRQHFHHSRELRSKSKLYVGQFEIRFSFPPRRQKARSPILAAPYLASRFPRKASHRRRAYRGRRDPRKSRASSTPVPLRPSLAELRAPCPWLPQASPQVVQCHDRSTSRNLHTPSHAMARLSSR